MSVNDFPGPLFTDLYELTMAAGYFEHHLDQSATFSLFLRACDVYVCIPALKTPA